MFLFLKELVRAFSGVKIEFNNDPPTLANNVVLWGPDDRLPVGISVSKPELLRNPPRSLLREIKYQALSQGYHPKHLSVLSVVYPLDCL